MSDYRNQSAYGRDRFRDDDDNRAFGRTDERTARRNTYGDEDRFRSESYASGREGDGRNQDRDDFRRDNHGRDYGSSNRGGSSGDYLSNASRGYGRSSYGGVDFDRSDRDRGFGGRSDYGSGSYGSDRSTYGSGGRDYGRGDYGAGRSFGSDRGSSEDRYREAFGYGSDHRDRDRDARRNSGYGADSNRPGERSFFERAGDEISSWFGDQDAERRRDEDRRYTGRGPKNYTRSDDRIRDDVNDRLTDDNYLDASDIEVTVKDREVTLSGHVATRDQKRRAEDVAERVSGVNHVQNNLRVQNQSQGQWTAGQSQTAGQTGYGLASGGSTASTGGFGSSTTGTSTTAATTDTTTGTGSSTSSFGSRNSSSI